MRPVDYLIQELKRIDTKYPELLQVYFLDYLRVLEHSADIGKYPLNNWLEDSGKGCDRKNMYASIFRHTADSYTGLSEDLDSGLDPHLHGTCRYVMAYTRKKLGLVHPLDYGYNSYTPDLCKDFFTYKGTDNGPL